MLRILYSLEARNYFFDNGELTRDLMIAVESLVFTGGLPEQGDISRVSTNLFMWVHLGHIVVYEIAGNNLTIEVVMPVE